MRISVFHKMMSTALSLLVLMSTLSLTIEKHFCGDVLVDVAIFSESDKCGMEMMGTDSESQLKIKSCCKDEVDVIIGQDDITVQTFDDLDQLEKQVLIAFAYSYCELFVGLPKLQISTETYKPPKLIQDIQMLHETYLI